jgi:hypothetical protein
MWGMFDLPAPAPITDTLKMMDTIANDKGSLWLGPRRREAAGGYANDNAP